MLISITDIPAYTPVKSECRFLLPHILSRCLLLAFSTSVILTAVRWPLTVVSIHTSLMAMDIEHFSHTNIYLCFF